MIFAPIGQSGQTLHFTEHVLQHFSNNRQIRFWNREAGGLLFARIVGNDLLVEHVTGPRPTDRRSRYSYQGDRAAEQREIDEQFARGLDYIGDWHTHPERRPRPSGADDHAMLERVTASNHQLLGFAFVIVGTAPFPEGLSVSVHDGAVRIDLAVALEPLAPDAGNFQ